MQEYNARMHEHTCRVSLQCRQLFHVVQIEYNAIGYNRQNCPNKRSKFFHWDIEAGVIVVVAHHSTALPAGRGNEQHSQSPRGEHTSRRNKSVTSITICMLRSIYNMHPPEMHTTVATVTVTQKHNSLVIIWGRQDNKTTASFQPQNMSEFISVVAAA
jgi:hypothetical protein